MKKKATEKSFIHRTSYPGGIKAMRTFIEDNMLYPQEAVNNGIGGIVAIMFDVNKDGKVSNAKIKHGIGFGCDEEALRLVGMLKYSSTKNRGVFVVFHETINIHFNLKEYLRKKNEEEMKKSKSVQPTVTYTITNQNENTNVTYTIKIGNNNNGDNNSE